jgi:hypothetical protein
MRIWDVPASRLCREHLLAEHRELHAIWNVILGGKKGYSRHPEVLRWRGKLMALSARHEEQVREMGARGYSHQSPLDVSAVPLAHMGYVQDELLEPVAAQVSRLRAKGCRCDARRRR